MSAVTRSTATSLRPSSPVSTQYRPPLQRQAWMGTLRLRGGGKRCTSTASSTVGPVTLPLCFCTAATARVASRAEKPISIILATWPSPPCWLATRMCTAGGAGAACAARGGRRRGSIRYRATQFSGSVPLGAGSCARCQAVRARSAALPSLPR